jgi:hypothetical protein
MNETDRKIKHELMLGLIYPAVLGSIFYTALDKIGHQFATFWMSWFAGGEYSVSAVVTVKFVLLAIAIGFYFCDYLYILFTNEYDDRFFRYDLTFVGTMYAAFAAIGMNSGEHPPWAKTMLFCYLLFMVLYLRWDRFEVERCEGRAERQLFRKVVRWEWFSILGIAVSFMVIMAVELLWKRALAPWIPGLVVAVVMAVVTTFFARYAWAKRRFSIRFPRTMSNRKTSPGRGAPNSAAQSDGYAAGWQ